MRILLYYHLVKNRYEGKKQIKKNGNTRDVAAAEERIPATKERHIGLISFISATNG